MRKIPTRIASETVSRLRRMRRNLFATGTDEARYLKKRMRTPLLELLEDRRVFASDWQNPLFRLDVNDDADVSPIDALVIINDLNSNGSRTLNEPIDNNAPSVFYLDSNADGEVSPIDVLLVVNHLNERPTQLSASLDLAVDSGESDTDQITNDGRIRVHVDLNGGSATTARVRVNRNQVVDIPIDSNGEFTIDPTSIDGFADGEIRVGMFVAGSAGGQTLRQLRFTLDTQAPQLDPLALNAADDTGPSNSDGVTRVASPRVFVGAEAGSRVLVDINGSTEIDEISSGPGERTLDSLPDGIYSIQASVRDVAGNIRQAPPLSLVIDTSAPTLVSLDLAETSDSGARGDKRTGAARVTLVGQTEPNLAVTIAGAAQTVRADGDGLFRVPNVALQVGDNQFEAQAIDLAGNSSSLVSTVTRAAEAAMIDPVLRWNQAALEAIRSDATAPPVATRGLAMMNVAMLDVVNAVEGTASYLVSLKPTSDLAIEAAISAAAAEVLTYLYPAQAAAIQTVHSAVLAEVPDGDAETAGAAFGELVGEAVIALRANDGWNRFVEHPVGTEPGDWQPTAPMFDVPLLPQWGQLTPFGIADVAAMSPAGPPDLTSAEYAAALDEVKSLGAASGSTRTADQTEIARFWADGAGSYTPPGHWNQIALEMAENDELSVGENARLFAMLNIALGDAGIVAWNVKYGTDFWRPITAIQNAASDGNPDTVAQANWTPLLISPAFPEYVSGHSTFSGAAEAVLTSYFGDSRAFSTTSLGLPGVTRSFSSIHEAAEEAGRSRIYGGIHYEFSNQDGLNTGRAIAAEVLERFSVTDDVRAPQIVFLQPKNGGVFATNPTIEGWAVDNLSGVATVEASVDGGGYGSVALDANGRFQFQSSLALDGSADGAHVIRFRATDKLGLVSEEFEFTFKLDTVAPSIAVDSPVSESVVAAGARLQGTAHGTGSKLVALNYRIDGGPTMPISFNPTNGAFTRDLDLSHLGVGNHSLVVTARDEAGFTGTQAVAFQIAAALPLEVSSHTPPAGASDVGVTFRPQVYFSRPVQSSTLTANSFYMTDAAGVVLPSTIVVSPDGTFAWLFPQNAMPGGATVAVHLKGDLILTADGVALDADGDGTAGGDYAYRFTTVSRTTVPGTSLAGMVVDPGDDLKPMTYDDTRSGPDGIPHTADDLFLNPIVGAKVYILGREDEFVFTDSEGRFSFASVPAGNIKLAIDGRTATNAPDGAFWPEMVMDLDMEAGRANTVMGTMGTQAEREANLDRPEVYLPRLKNAILTPIAADEPTVVTVDAQSAPNLTEEQRQYLKLEVQPGSVIGEDGLPIENPQVGLSTVPPELVRDMLPPGLLQHTFDITIQAPGAVAFSPPARLTFPNIFNAPAGSQVEFLSFDHTTGRLVFEGTATVSEDGKSVTTDPGTGITKPGWHGGPPPGTETKPPKKPEPKCEAWNSDDTWALASALTQALKQLTNFRGIIKTGLDAVTAVAQLRSTVDQLQKDWKAGSLSREGLIAGLQGLNATKNFAKSAYENFTATNPLNKLGNSIAAIVKVANTALDRIAARGPQCLGVGGSIATNIAREVLTLADRMLGNILDLEKSIRNAPLTAVCLVFESLLNQVSNAQTGAGEGEGEGPTPLTDEELDAALQSIIDASDDFIAGNQSVMEAIDTNTADANGELDTLDEDLVSPLVVGDGAVQLGYWRVLVGTTEIRGRTNESGIINPLPFLPPETPYRFEIYDFAHQVVSTSIGISAVSGTDTELAPFRSESLIGEPDSDMDGLADLAEQIVGTAIDRVDTDGDGIADFAELEQGLNPLGNRPFATGVVGSLPLNGEAREIVIEGGLANDQSQTAYLATGSFGLAIVDASRFQQPLLISELDLPGNNVDVSVDSRLGIAAVASDEGLHLVDVGMPSQPQLLQTLRGNFSQVEVMDGLAFVASGSGLRVYDLLTGDRILAGSVSGDTIMGMAREGSRFYFRSTNGDFTVVDFVSGSLVTRGTLNVESTPGKVFVANGVAYLSAEDGFNGGFSTVDVSDSDDPQLLSGVDNISFAGQSVVVNGSGLAIAVGNPGGVFGANALDLVDINDPTDTSQFQTRYVLPAAPSSVVLAAGIAFVAGGESGLQVVNYRSFDSAGVAPTVSIDLSDEDADLDLDGIQIQEGTLLSVRPTVSDDVQVRGVQLLINGEVVASDVSFPFDLSTLLPTIEQIGGGIEGTTEIVVSVRASDTGGNIGVSEDITVQLVPDTFAPALVSTNIPDGSRQGVMFRAVKFTFSEPIDGSTIHGESFVLVGPNGAVDPLDVQFRDGGRAVQITYPELPLGQFTMTVHADMVTDIAGNSLGASDLAYTFEKTTYTAVWSNPAGGSWDDPANWDGGLLPGPDADVLIDVEGDAIVEFNGLASIRSLVLNDTLSIIDGELEVTDSVIVGGTLQLAGGWLRGARVSAESDQAVVEMPTLVRNGGFDGVTLAMNIQVGQYSTLGVRNDLTLENATVDLSVSEQGDGWREMYVIGASAIRGVGEIHLSQQGDYDWSYVYGDVLTIGEGVTIHGAGEIDAGQIINRGVILADVPGAAIYVYAYDSVVNEGAMKVRGGAMIEVWGIVGDTNELTIEDANSSLAIHGNGLTINQPLTVENGQSLSINEYYYWGSGDWGAWSNQSVLTVNDGGTLNLGGRFTQADLGDLVRTGGTVNLIGILDNQAAATETLVGPDSPVKAFVPTDGSLGSDWLLPGFDDSAWLSGVGAVGYDQRDTNNLYDTRIGLDVEASAFDQNGMVFVRYPFTIADPDALARIELDIAYDDGYVAYLNGVELGRQQTSAGSAEWNSNAWWFGDDVRESLRLNDYAYLLRPGENVLAFQVVNYADDDVDLFIEPTLQASLRANDVPFEFNAQTGWWNLDSGMIVGGEISTTDEVGLNITSSYGTLDRVTLVSDFTIPPGFYFYARNDLTLDQVTLTLAQPEEVAATSRVELVGHSRLAGSGIVRLEMNSSGYTSHLGGEIVGVDANVTVAGTGYFWAQELYNQGTIIADGSGETLDVDADKLVNTGTLSATNGASLTISGLMGEVGNLTLVDEGSSIRLDGMEYVLNQSITIGAGQVLTLEGSWSNVATITVEAGGTLNLGGSFTLNDVGDVVNNGGSINITGTLDNRAPRDVELVGATTTWSYFVPNDDSLGSSWQLPSFGTPPTGIHNVTSPNDVNNDGSVSPSDLLALGNAINGLSVTGDLYLDVNNDGQVSLDDWNAVWVALGSPDNIDPPTGPVAWNTGVGSLGYDRRIEGNEYSDLIDVNIENDVYDQNGSVYVRYPFTIADPDALAGLTLDVRFDDAFVAYLNGEEIARGGGVGDTDWNTTAAWESEGGAEVFEIESYAHLFRSGANVLAIQLLNVAADNEDLFLHVALQAGSRAAEGTLELNATTGSWTLAGGTILGGTIEGSDGQTLLTSDGSFGTLDGVTLATDVAISDAYSLFVRNNLALSDSDLTLAHADDVQGWNNVDFGLSGRIVGSGTVFLATNNLGYSGSLSATELTIDPGIEIRGTGSISTTTLVNRGTIIADISLAAINVFSETFTNSGTLIARAGSSFYLNTDVVLTSESTLVSEVEGSESDDFGNFGVTSDIQFDGTLAIDAINGFTPDVGYTFMPIMMSTGNGSFAAVDGGALAFSVTIGANDVTVERTAGLALSGTGVAAGTASEIGTGELAIIVESAIERWWDEGKLSAEQRAMLQALSFSIVDFGTSSQLGMARGDGIVIDNDAAGVGWYVDRTPLVDEEYSTVGSRVVAKRGAEAAERVDLLSAVMHELAHWLGAEHSDDPAELMYESLAVGERKTAWPDELDGLFQNWE